MQGERLGPYLIQRELGAGGMGVVYEAVAEDGTRVALKVVHSHLLAESGAVERFLREAEVGRRIAHPNVIRTLDAGEHEGRPYIALEFVVGGTLHDLRQELQRIPETLCRHIGREAARGLEAIHAEGIVHRDIKPENILITPDHEIRLLDLGLARHATGADRLTRTGHWAGTVHYCPPEQFQGEGELDLRSDLYSLGATLYELATGQRPFDAGTLQALVRKVLDDPPPRPGTLCTQLSPFFEELLLTLLHKNPAKRIQSAAALGDILEEGEATAWWSHEVTLLEQATRGPLRRIRIPRETECVGRDDELAALRIAFDAAKGGEGRVILLEGEAGIGKSRLIDELMRRLEEAGEDVHFLFGSYPPGGAATAAGAFSTAYGEQFGNEGCARYLTEASLLAPAFDALIRGDVAPKDAEPLTSDSLKTVLVHTTRALARERPTVVVIDDLHFAPDEGRALFASLAMAVPGHSILLVGTARPGLPKNWYADLERLEHVSRSQVQRLGAADVSRLLDPVIGTSPQAEQLAGSIAATADGNPFFLFEIVRSLRESGVLTKGDDGSWATTSDVTEIELPDTVQSLLDARVDRLSSEERELLDCAACWGFEFDGRLIAEALGMRRLPALRLLGGLEQEHGLVRAAGSAFVFDHHAIQEHLHARLPGAMREELHAALAETLEQRSDAAEKDPETLDGALCVDLATHFLEGARGEAALRYLSAARTHLEKGYLHARAIHIVERALAMPGVLTGARRADTLLDLYAALEFVGSAIRRDQVVHEAERLADHVDEPALHLRVCHHRGWMYQDARRLDEAETAFRRAVEIADGLEDRDAAEKQRYYLAQLLLHRRRFAEAHEQVNRCLAYYATAEQRDGEPTCVSLSARILQTEGRMDEAVARFEQCVALCHERGDRVGEGWARCLLGWAHRRAGRLDEARTWSESAIDIFRAIGGRRNEVTVAGEIGGILRAQGRVDESRAMVERCFAINREIGFRHGQSAMLSRLANLARDDGDLAQAREYYEESLRAAGAGYDVAETAAILLRIASLASEADDSERFVHARDVAVEYEMPTTEALARCELAALPGGDAQDAQDAQDALDRYGDQLQPEDLRWARLLLWRATGDRAHLDEAKRLLDETLAAAPAEDREAIATNLYVNREILAAWRAETGEGTSDHDDGLTDPEALTRIE